eukprot:4431939-Karenia_brevis.AAC.1
MSSLVSELVDFPAPGCGGVVMAEQLAEGSLKHMLQDPVRAELPDDLKPEDLACPRVHCNNAEFLKLSVKGLRCGVFTTIPEAE